MSNLFPTIGSAPVQPSLTSYNTLTVTTGGTITLVWPDQALGANVLADVLDVQVVGAGVTPGTVILPDARRASTGPAAIIRNVGLIDFNLLDSASGSVAVVRSGETRYLILGDNTTQAGVWSNLVLGIAPVLVDAESLTGPGIESVGGTLRLFIGLTVRSLGILDGGIIDASERAKLQRWTGGTGTLGMDLFGEEAGWFCGIRNDGSGLLTLEAIGSATFDGEATKSLSQGDACLLVWDGAGFFSIGLGRVLVPLDTSIVLPVGGFGTVTLTSIEAASRIQRYTGALTGARNINFGSSPGIWTVTNSTTGAFTLTLRTNNTDSPGAVIPQGLSAVIASDGANMRLISSGGAGTVVQVNTGAGLQGGPIVSAGSISITDTGVAAGTYGQFGQGAAFVVNSRGQMTGVAAFASSEVTSVVFQPGAGTLGTASLLTAGAGLLCDTSGAAGVVNLPTAGLLLGQCVRVEDAVGLFWLNPITIRAGTQAIAGAVEPLTVDRAWCRVDLTWLGSSAGWAVQAS